MGGRNANAVLHVFRADAEGIKGLAAVIHIVFSTLFDLFTHVIFGIARSFKHHDTGLYRFSLGLGVVKEPHIFLGILLHFLLVLLGEHLVSVLFLEEQLFLQGLCILFHAVIPSFFKKFI